MDRCGTCGERPQYCQCKDEVCANCGKTYRETSFGLLCRFIMKKQPGCCYECNKALGQVK